MSHQPSLRFVLTEHTKIRRNRGADVDLLTTHETAEFLHIPLATLRHWIATNQAPPSARIGRRRMFLKRQLEDFVQAKFDAAAAPDDKTKPAQLGTWGSYKSARGVRPDELAGRPPCTVPEAGQPTRDRT